MLAGEFPTAGRLRRGQAVGLGYPPRVGTLGAPRNLFARFSWSRFGQLQPRFCHYHRQFHSDFA